MITIIIIIKLLDEDDVFEVGVFDIGVGKFDAGVGKFGFSVSSFKAAFFIAFSIPVTNLPKFHKLHELDVVLPNC